MRYVTRPPHFNYDSIAVLLRPMRPTLCPFIMSVGAMTVLAGFRHQEIETISFQIIAHNEHWTQIYGIFPI